MTGAEQGWTEMMKLALAMGLAPDVFWRLSLKEWRMLIEPAVGPSLGRGELERMVEAWPDE